MLIQLIQFQLSRLSDISKDCLKRPLFFSKSVGTALLLTFFFSGFISANAQASNALYLSQTLSGGVSELISGSADKNSSKDESSASDDSENSEKEKPKDSNNKQQASESSDANTSTNINFSESIPVDDIVESWQKEYKEVMTELGLNNSINSRLLATALIILIVFLGRVVAKKITKAIRKYFRSFIRKYRIDSAKVNFYYKMIYGLLSVIVVICGITALMVTWDISIKEWISEELLTSFFANAFTVYAIILLGSIVIETATGVVEISLHRWRGASQSRINTLLPIAKNTIYVVFITLFLLILLSELGINVMPLLAGAGVVGIAIGFGAQTLVKDLLTGFIIILEDLVQIGDVVTLAGRTGAIEKITIRKIQLRDLSGVVYTVPFSEISIVENMTKEYSYAMFDVGVAYREDTDYVVKLMQQIDESMRDDSDFKPLILESLEILGVDKFADSAVVIKARLKTKAAEQWAVRREFNRRIKHLFDKENIEIPFPHQTIYFGEDKEGKAPPVRLLQEEANEASEANHTDPDKAKASNSGDKADSSDDKSDKHKKASGQSTPVKPAKQPSNEESSHSNRYETDEGDLME